MKRKIFISIAFICLFAQIGIAGKPDTLAFLHISDIHLLFDLEVIQKDLAEERARYEKGVELFNQFMQNIPNKTNADFIVATGDLIDYYKGETQNKGMYGMQIEQFSKLLDSYNLPFYAILGNHDIVEYTWDTTRVSSQRKARKARTVWKNNLECFKNGIYYAHDHEVGETNYKLIYLDDSKNLFRKTKPGIIPFIDKAQQRWLKKQLNESSDDIEIVIMHIPFLQQNPDEVGNNLYSILRSHPSVKMVLAGHNHKNRIRKFNAEGVPFYQVQTGGLSSSSDVWRLIRLTEKSILISEPGKTENELILQINER